jgi:uncharacterized protein YgbK (DUF1537 family)
MLLTACATTMEEGLTPQQAQLRQGVGQWNAPDYVPKVRTAETQTQGALFGALLGAVAGAALSNNRAQGAAIGAGLGGVGGYGVGTAVANNAQTQANTEAALTASINRANADANTFRGYAAAARQSSASARQQIEALDARYRRGELTAAQFRSQTSVYRRDLDSMTKLAADAERTRAAMVTAGMQSNSKSLDQSGQGVGSAGTEISQAAAELSNALLLVPAA